MYGDGDGHALSSDSTPISPSNPKHLPLMESEYGQHLGCNNSCGLLRFRSAPNSLLANFPDESPTMGFSRIRNDATSGMNGNLNDDKCNKGFGRLNSQLPPQYPRQSGLSSIEGHRRIDSNLMRQNSSPAGLLSHLNSQNGYPGIRSYRVTDGGEDISTCSTIFKNHMNLENESGGGFPFGSWNDSSYFAENIKSEADSDDPKVFVNTERSEPGNRVNSLSRHLSLPKTSAEMAKMLQLQHPVPFKVRAKRGCATHPRSIAERVRRTRISERMRKLQELVPNMDKQTNTADMLDFAVEYIKSLQKQYKTLDDLRANCNCSAFSKC